MPVCIGLSLRVLVACCVAVAGCFAPAWSTFDDGSFFRGATCEVRVEADGWTLINDNHERRLTVDANGLRTTSVLKKPENVSILPQPVSEGSFFVDGAPFDLSQGWTLDSSSITDHGIYKQLVVTMRHSVHPWTVDVSYRVYQGTRFWIRKEFAYHFDVPRTLSNIKLETLAVPAQMTYGWYYQADNFTMAQGGNYQGHPLATGVFTNGPWLGAFGERINDAANNFYALIAGWNNTVRRQDFTGLTAFSLYFRGSRTTAQFALQLCVACAHAHGHPWYIPPVFMTWYSDGPNVTAQMCYDEIPLAAQIGCKIFLVDDGWQKNATGNGAYGDWLHNTVKFPDRLIGVKNMAQQYGMELGFWFAPGWSQGSQIRTENPAWAIKYPSGAVSDNLTCLASGWGDWIRDRIMTVFEEASPRLVKVDLELFRNECVGPTHNHDAEKALGEQHEKWREFVADMRSERPDLIISRTQSKTTLNDLHDEGWQNDWMISSRQDAPRIYDPVRWKKTADNNRAELWDAMRFVPGFSFTATAPAYVPNLQSLPGLGAMAVQEYLLVSVAAMVANIEISNQIVGIQPQNIALAQKWIDFNWRMRPWLSYTQPITKAHDPSRQWALTEWVDAIWHLRPLYRGRYGFLVVFNSNMSTLNYTASIDPREILIENMDVANLSITAMNPAVTTWVNESANGRLQFTLAMPGASWQILDIGTSLPWTEGDVDGDNVVTDADLTAIILDFGGLPSGMYGPTDVTGDGSVDDIDLTVALLNYG